MVHLDQNNQNDEILIRNEHYALQIIQTHAFKSRMIVIQFAPS